MKERIVIAAAGENNELGKDSDLPWHLPDDFRHFKEQTSGFPMIMGRKTFETFPKPLPNRRHIVVTRDKNYRVPHPACDVVHSLDEALAAVTDTSRVFIIGGGEIYRQALPLSNRIELTRVHASFEADTYFPEIEPDQWELIRSQRHEADERHNYAFTFQTYIRKS